MRCFLYVVDTIGHWSEAGAVRQRCKAQYDVFAYDPDEVTHCCEFTPSYCLWPTYATFLLKDGRDHDDDELMEKLDMEVSDALDWDCSYIHCHSIDALPKFQDDAIPMADLPSAFVVEWHEDDEAETVDDFIECIRGNPPL